MVEEIRFTKTYNIFDSMLLMEYISKTKPLWQNPPENIATLRLLEKSLQDLNNAVSWVSDDASYRKFKIW